MNTPSLYNSPKKKRASLFPLSANDLKRVKAAELELRYSR